MKLAVPTVVITWVILSGCFAPSAVAQTGNILSRSWTETARKWGICTGPGYHGCPRVDWEAEAMYAVNRSEACMPDGIGPPRVHAPAASGSWGTMMHGGTMVGMPAIAPTYMMPDNNESFEEYIQPVPETDSNYRQPIITDESDLGGTSNDGTPELSAPAPVESLPAPTPERDEPDSPSDRDDSQRREPTPRQPKPAPRLPQPKPRTPERATIQPLPQPSDSPEPIRPKPTQPEAIRPKPTQPEPLKPSQPRASQPDAAPRTPPQTKTPELPEVPDSPFKQNDDDLLVPPDTGLLDSASRSRSYYYPLKPAMYQSHGYGERVIREPRRY